MNFNWPVLIIFDARAKSYMRVRTCSKYCSTSSLSVSDDYIGSRDYISKKMKNQKFAFWRFLHVLTVFHEKIEKTQKRKFSIFIFWIYSFMRLCNHEKKTNLSTNDILGGFTRAYMILRARQKLLTLVHENSVFFWLFLIF